MIHSVHVLLACISGFAFISLIRFLSTRGRLSLRYTLGWLIIGLLSLFYPILLLASEWVSELLDIQPALILIGLPLIVLLLVCIQLSISVSGLIEQVRVLLEEVAFLKEAKTQDPNSDNELDQSEH